MIARTCLAAIVMPLLWGQSYDLLLKGGHVLDPAGNIDGLLDVAISGNRIARVAAGIEPKEATKSVNVAGLYVTPGVLEGFVGSIKKTPARHYAPACQSRPLLNKRAHD